MTATDLALKRSIDALKMPGILIDHRLISPGDEFALVPEELSAFASSIAKVKRASGAARIVARKLMLQLGHAQQALPKAASGAPIWPTGLVGSLAHDSQFAVAAIARSDDFYSLGVDVEPAEPLEADLLNLIATASELKSMTHEPWNGRLLFAIKEAVYKSAFPLDGIFLDHHDVEVNLTAGTATIRNGRTVRFRHSLSPRILVLAFI